MRLKNATQDVLEIPSLRVTAAPGEEFECPDELAGEVPGGWRAPTDAEIAEGYRGLVTRVNEETKAREVLSPGSGLLATGNYEPAELPKAPARKKAAAGPEPTATATAEEGDN